MTDTLPSNRTFFRKSLVVPAEHGAWSWLLVPFLVGTIVGAASITAARLPGLAVVLTLIGGLSAYMIRQPATAWLRIRRGRGKKSDEPLALGWTIGLSVVALLCLAGLLLLGRTELVALVIPFGMVLGLYLLAARRGRAAMRAMEMELAGAIGLALMAPAAFIAATGEFKPPVVALGVLMALQNALGVLYVRLRLADTKQRAADRRLTLWGHWVVFTAVLVTGALGYTPLLAAVPFAGFLVRALWAVRVPRPVPDVKRFGFTEVGAELLSGALIALAYI